MPTDGPADPERILGDSDTGPSHHGHLRRVARVCEGGGPPTCGAIHSPGTSGDYRVRVALLQLWADGKSERIWCGVSSLNGQDALGVNGLARIRDAHSRIRDGFATIRDAFAAIRG